MMLSGLFSWLFREQKKKTATCLMEAAFKAAMFTKLTPGRFNYSIVRTSDMPGTVLGFMLSPTELRFEAVELFTVSAVRTIKPLLSISHVTRFLFVACHVHIDLIYVCSTYFLLF